MYFIGAIHIYMQEQLTPLHFASIKGHYDIAQLLLEWEAELNARSDVSCNAPVSFICPN